MEFAFDCVYYHVADLDRAVSFYRDILGFRFLSRDRVARFDIDGVLLELVPADDQSRPGSDGNARLCLRVTNMAATLNDLKLRGVEAKPPRDVGEGIVGMFKDTDGNEICLWQPRQRDNGEGSICL